MKPKLVRDRIPSIIRSSGRNCLAHTVKNKEEHYAALGEKFFEEFSEFLEDPSPAEAADLLEIIKTLCYLEGISFVEALSFSEEKARVNGGFTEGVILESISPQGLYK